MPNHPRFPRQITILYEDDVLIAIDKPAGLVAVPIKGSDMPCAWAILNEELKRRRQHVFVVHRIDRFTSGVLLFAKTAVARDSLIRQFLKHTPLRQYLAVVRGRVVPGEGTLVHFLRREGMYQKLSRQGDSEAARAEMIYKVERPLRGASLVRVTLLTGLQNQIRVQFSAAGHPVVGDRKYHPKESEETRIARVALHAVRLKFVHPVGGETVDIESKPPADFRSLVEGLNRTDRAPRG